MSRAENRSHERRMKNRAAAKLKANGFEVTPKEVGKNSSVHGAACSCPLCGNLRKVAGETIQEKRSKIIDEE